MKLNHLHVSVTDVPTMVRRLSLLFGLRCVSNASSPAMAILSDDAGFTLVVQRHASPQYPEDFHFGFLVDEPADVHAFRARAVATGEEVGDVVVNARGTLCYCKIDRLLVEVSSHRPVASAERPKR